MEHSVIRFFYTVRPKYKALDKVLDKTPYSVEHVDNTMF